MEIVPPEGSGSVSPGPAAGFVAPGPDASRLARIVYWMEDRFRIPGTQVRFGLDAILGLFLPGVGDLATLLVGIPILVSAARRRHPWRVLLMMVVNLLLDSTLGSIPLIGDLFDIFWKAQRKNLTLLEDPSSSAAMWQQARGRLVAVCAVLVLLLFGALALLSLSIRWLEKAVTGI